MADDSTASALITLDFDELLAAEFDVLQRRLSEHHALMRAAMEVDCNRRLQEMKETMFLKSKSFDLDIMADMQTNNNNYPEFEVEIDQSLPKHRAASINNSSVKMASLQKEDSDQNVAAERNSKEADERFTSVVYTSSAASSVAKTSIAKSSFAKSSVAAVTAQGSRGETSYFEDSLFGSPFQKPNRTSNESDNSRKSHARRVTLTNVISLCHDQDELEMRMRAEKRSVMPDKRFSAMYYDEQSAWFEFVQRARELLAAFLRHPATELFIAVLILSNSIVVGLEVDWTVRNPSETKLPIGFSVLGYTFNLLFAIEILMRIFALMGEFFTGNQWGWNLFDLSLVVASIIEFTIELLYLTGTQNFSSLRIVKIVRITRILRVLRVARVVRLLVALRLLFVQILGTLRSVFWAMVLLLLILYTFGMVFAQVATGHIAERKGERFPGLERYWSTVPRSMFTLYKSITGGVDWENVAFALSDIHWIWVGMFVVYLSFTIFAVLNVVVGVFCQSAIETATLDHENAIRLKMTERVNFARKIRALFWNMSDTMEGELTYHELEAHLKDDHVAAYFETLGIDTSDAWDLFKLLDKDFSQCVDVEEFIRGIMHLRGPAKILDVEKIMFENRQMRKQLAAFMRRADSFFKNSASGSRESGTRDFGTRDFGTTLPVAHQHDDSIWYQCSASASLGASNFTKSRTAFVHRVTS